MSGLDPWCSVVAVSSFIQHGFLDKQLDFPPLTLHKYYSRVPLKTYKQSPVYDFHTIFLLPCNMHIYLHVPVQINICLKRFPVLCCFVYLLSNRLLPFTLRPELLVSHII